MLILDSLIDKTAICSSCLLTFNYKAGSLAKGKVKSISLKPSNLEMTFKIISYLPWHSICTELRSFSDFGQSHGKRAEASQ